ncbi:MAG: hypothetical protein V1722_02085 [Candidatus Micrarchaeota archaeon]
MKKQENTIKIAAIVALVAAVLLVGPNLTGYVTAASPTSSGSNYVEIYLAPNLPYVPIGASGYKIAANEATYGQNGRVSTCNLNITKPTGAQINNITLANFQPTRQLPNDRNSNLYLHLDEVTPLINSLTNAGAGCRISAFFDK